MVEHGLTEAANYVPSRPLSPSVKVPKVTGLGSDLTSVSHKDRTDEGSVLTDERTVDSGMLRLDGSEGDFESSSSTQQLNFIECQTGPLADCSELETAGLSEATKALKKEATSVACESPPRIHCTTSSKLLANGAECGSSPNAHRGNTFAGSGHSEMRANDNSRLRGGDSKNTSVTKVDPERGIWC